MRRPSRSRPMRGSSCGRRKTASPRFPPGPDGDAMARQLLDAAWDRYPALVPTLPSLTKTTEDAARASFDRINELLDTKETPIHSPRRAVCRPVRQQRLHDAGDGRQAGDGADAGGERDPEDRAGARAHALRPHPARRREELLRRAGSARRCSWKGWRCAPRRRGAWSARDRLHPDRSERPLAGELLCEKRMPC